MTKKGPEPRPHLTAALGEEGRARAQSFLATLPGYLPTPLVGLPALAQASGVAAIHVKDEAKRFGLKSFKALLACLADSGARAHLDLGLGPQCRILVFNSEGATDSAIYARIVGRTPEEVAP